MQELHWKSEPGIRISSPVPTLHKDSWIEAPAVVQANLAPHNLIQIGAFTGIYGGKIGHCQIGRYCSIAPGVDIASDQHPTNWVSSSMVQYVAGIHDWGEWLRKNDYTYHEPLDRFKSNAVVTIGNDVWIGQGAFIKSGTSIGTGAIVAAHTVVTQDIPPYAIVAGVPGKIIKYRFDPETIQRIQSLAWWNYNIMGLAEFHPSQINTALDAIAESIAINKLEKLPDRKYIFHEH